MRFAQTIKDDSMAAGLVKKAADLKEQIDVSTRDRSAQAPDVEPRN